MTLHILHSRPTRPTAQRLADMLGVTCGRERAEIPKETTHLLRWGNSSMSVIDESIPHILNPAEHTSAIMNREHTFRALQERTFPIYCSIPRFVSHHFGPTLGARPIEDYGRDETVLPVWVYRTRFGSQGRYIQPIYRNCPFPRRIPDGFIVEWIDSDREVRVHIFQNKSISLQLKMKDGSPDTEGFQIRSHRNGWTLWPLNQERATQWTILDRSIPRDFARWAIETLHLDFGAVDLIRKRDTNHWYFLEVNTAPGLEGQTLDAYVRHIREWVGRTP